MYEHTQNETMRNERHFKYTYMCRFPLNAHDGRGNTRAIVGEVTLSIWGITRIHLIHRSPLFLSYPLPSHLATICDSLFSKRRTDNP